MSGPDYPRDSSLTFDYWDTVMSQYANSPILTQLIANIWEYLDPSANIELFHNNIWNIDTATGEGLDIWGRIVGVDRILTVSTESYFGFAQSSTAKTFGEAPFYSGGNVGTGNVTLSDDAYRTLIMVKAAANITDGSIASYNALLLSLFQSSGEVFVADAGQDVNGTVVPAMSAWYVFNFTPTATDLAILRNSGAVMRPTGVDVTIYVVEHDLFVPLDSDSLTTSDGNVLYVKPAT